MPPNCDQTFSKYQRLVVFGCSLTKDNYIDTWANLLAKHLKLPLINLAERGAGYKYIVQKIMSTVDLSHSDLVCIMWPSADRLDLWVNSSTPHLVNDLDHASWLDGKKPNYIDYDQTLTTDHGWYINGAVPRGYKHIYYKYFYNKTTHVNDAWTAIALIQNFLKVKKISCVMCNSYPLTNLIQYQDDEVDDCNWKLYDAIDLSMFVEDSSHNGFIQLAVDHGFVFFNPHYPNTDAHKWFLERYIMPKLKI